MAYMKLPPEIPICGRVYKVTYDSDITGASFRILPPRIVIGTDPRLGHLEVMNNIAHEVMEVILAEFNLRSTTCFSSENEFIRFMFNHDDYDNVMQAFVGAMTPFWKLTRSM